MRDINHKCSNAEDTRNHMGGIFSLARRLQSSNQVAPDPISVVPNGRGRKVHPGPGAKIAPTKDTKRPKPASLMKSIKTGDISAVRTCLELGWKVNEPGMWGNTPLICACQYGREAIALLLLDSGAAVYSVNHRGANALLYACLEGLAEVVARLGSFDNDEIAKVHAKIFNFSNDSYAEYNPLSAASVNGHLDVLQLLFKRYAWDESSLQQSMKAAVCGKHAQCVELILSCAPQSIFVEAIPYAVIGAEGLTDIAEVLIQAGFDTPQLAPILLAACEYHQLDVCQLLLERGVVSSALATQAGFACCHFHNKACLDELLCSKASLELDLAACDAEGETLATRISQTFNVTTT